MRKQQTTTDYLRELPEILFTAVETIRKLAEANLSCTTSPWDRRENDCNLLKERSGILYKEATAVKQSVCPHHISD